MLLMHFNVYNKFAASRLFVQYPLLSVSHEVHVLMKLQNGIIIKIA